MHGLADDGAHRVHVQARAAAALGKDDQTPGDQVRNLIDTARNGQKSATQYGRAACRWAGARRAASDLGKLIVFGSPSEV
ncbi:hypothetical protein, partial [Streptomyces sp. NPDC050485]|uniref:hypothetical protein n=1 Tax=Streptomyces sp. NPDC050485 TaxID=3365617 RepID=UPI0037AA8A7A